MSLTIAGSAAAGDAAVDADLDRLLQGEEVADLLGQRPGAGDDAQVAVGVEPLHHGQVVVEGLVQQPHRDRGDVLDAVRPRGWWRGGWRRAGVHLPLGLLLSARRFGCRSCPAPLHDQHRHACCRPLSGSS